MSKVVVFGAGGPLGAAVAEELTNRGHAVTGVTRRGEGAVAGDAFDAAAVAELVHGADVVVNAVGPRWGTDPRDSLVRVAHGLIDGLRKAGVAAHTDIHPGERTGTFRKGGDVLLLDADGRSAIADADFAIGVAEEIESPASVRKQITFAY